MNKFGALSQKAWVAVGNIENWERGLENGIWGIVPELEHHWQRLKNNDLVLFYCKAPVKKFFGTGIIRSKFKQTSPLWREEIEAGKVIWPFRLEFDVVHLLSLDEWRQLGITNKIYNLPVLGGLNPIGDFSKAMSIVNALSEVANVTVAQKDNVVNLVYEIGKIQRMVVESRYPIENNYLDVIWKRTIRSVPTYAFSILGKSKPEESINPLKSAYDIWNSRPFLIADKERFDDIGKMTAGLYHEFSSVLKILTTDQVQELYNSKKKYYELETQYGLR